MAKSSLGLIGVVALLGAPAFAGDLKSPFALEIADTLPKNVRSPRFINVFASITSRFADDGSTEGLGAQLNKDLLWSDVLSQQEDPIKRSLVQAVMQDAGLNESGSPGVSRGEVNTYANVKVAALAWGITDRFTIAGVLPIVKIDVSAATGFEGGSEWNEFAARVAKNSSPNAAREATQQANDGINRKLLNLGYQPIPASQTISGVGDAQLIGKYRLFSDGVNMVGLKGTVIFPTGIEPNPDKALDIPTGDGRMGVGLAAIYDRRLPFDFRWNTTLGATAMLPHHIVKRIPTSVRDSLSADKEEMYERTRMTYSYGTGLEYLIAPAGILLSTGYNFQFQERADYEPGTALDPARYYLLGDRQPLQSLHSMVVSAAFSTIDWYRRKKFVYPMQLGVAYSRPLLGRNVASNDVLAGELVVFF